MIGSGVHTIRPQFILFPKEPYRQHMLQMHRWRFVSGLQDNHCRLYTFLYDLYIRLHMLRCILSRLSIHSKYSLQKIKL